SRAPFHWSTLVHVLWSTVPFRDRSRGNGAKTRASSQLAIQAQSPSSGPSPITRYLGVGAALNPCLERCFSRFASLVPHISAAGSGDERTHDGRVRADKIITIVDAGICLAAAECSIRHQSSCGTMSVAIVAQGLCAQLSMVRP